MSLHQAKTLRTSHLQKALKLKRDMISYMVEKVEPRELRVLLREASLVCPGYFPSEVLEQATAIITRTLDSGALRQDLKRKLERSSADSRPPRRNEAPPVRTQSFRSGSQKGSRIERHRGRSFRRPQFSSAASSGQQSSSSTPFVTSGNSFRRPAQPSTSRGTSKGSRFSAPHFAPSAAPHLQQTSSTQSRPHTRRGTGQGRGRGGRRGAH